jgi:hypothetical protein
VLFLGAGLWFLLEYCHGTVGLAFAFPISLTKFNTEVVTMGAPVFIGVPLTVIGLLLLVVAFLKAIVEQFWPLPRARHNEALNVPNSPVEG